MQLPFYWRASFKDGSVLNQYDKTGEHRFAEIQWRFHELDWFSLIHEETGYTISVNLKYGYITDTKGKVWELNNEIKNNIRLIYFVRNTVTTTIHGLQTVAHVRIWHVGFQYNDQNNHNFQVILKIDKDGNFCV